MIARVRRALRKKRLRSFPDVDPPPVAQLDFRLPLIPTHAEFMHFRAEILGLRGYNSPRTWADRLQRLQRPTALLIDLAAYPDLSAYMKGMWKLTGGNLTRDIKKAVKTGYVIRPVDPAARMDDIRTIFRSKLVRSGGFVIEAVSDRHVQARLDRRWLGAHLSDRHWVINLGAFQRDEDRMVAFASLKRAGDLLIVDDFIGDAALLREGSMKITMHDIIRRALERPDPDFAELRYIQYGSIEQGNEGIVGWKKDFAFRPFLLAGAEELWTPPPDFDPARYLALHSDVQAAGADPAQHYLDFGLYEGRPYK